MWTAIYYFKPLYWLLLSTKATKTILFRGFGYKGPIEMVTYPDTWIRDLPLLHLGKGAYLANKATIGTNMCLSDGTILVDKISIGENSVIGHLCMLAPGVQIGSNSETGSGCAIGIGVILGNQVRIGPMALINHGARITDGVKVGASCYIGSKVQINVKGLSIPGSTNIPDNSVINSESDLHSFIQKRA
ncbi:MAG: hypothetical protein EOP10_28430 [Proteobacteria bacterium]|nr:MAG: hypothetical protein EOP10_28430 [Pseudomonadota bacterium]